MPIASSNVVWVERSGSIGAPDASSEPAAGLTGRRGAAYGLGPMAEAAQRRPLAWLAAGAAAGVALAAWGLLGGDARRAALPEGVVASVNGTPIYADDYLRLVEGVESDTREPAGPDLRRRVLDRMI